MLQKLRPSSSYTDHLFVGTDRFAYFTLSWDSEVQQFRTEKSCVYVADKTLRDTQSESDCLKDPDGRFLIIELYRGVIIVVPIAQLLTGKDSELGRLKESISSRIPESSVISSVFLQRSTDKPRLALLYEDSHEKFRLKIRHLGYIPGTALDDGVVEFDEAESPSGELEFGASHLIPVPEPTCTCAWT